LDKVNTYAKAQTTNKADEQATIHSKMVIKDPAATTDLNFVSAYKKVQKKFSQAAQPHCVGYSSSPANRGSYSRSYTDQGAHFNQVEPEEVTHKEGGLLQSRELLAVQPRQVIQRRSQSTVSQSNKCDSCDKINHPHKTCWAFTKDCQNCKKGHIESICCKPLKQDLM
jgi:hypothetical protein